MPPRRPIFAFSARSFVFAPLLRMRLRDTSMPSACRTKMPHTGSTWLGPLSAIRLSRITRRSTSASEMPPYPTLLTIASGIVRERPAQAAADVVADDREPFDRDEFVGTAQIEKSRDADAVHAHVINAVALDEDLGERAGRRRARVAVAYSDGIDHDDSVRRLSGSHGSAGRGLGQRRGGSGRLLSSMKIRLPSVMPLPEPPRIRLLMIRTRSDVPPIWMPPRLNVPGRNPAVGAPARVKDSILRDGTSTTLRSISMSSPSAKMA